MRFAWLSLGILWSGCAAAAPDTQLRQEDIIGGTLDDGDPAVGILLSSDGWFCSGTLITPTLLLTAAHCVKDATPSTTFRVYFGTDLGQAQASDWHAVREFHYHPQFGRLTHGYDCGLLVLAEPINSTAPIRFRHYPLTQDLIGQPIRVVGYGISSNSDPSSYGVKRQLGGLLASFDYYSIIVGQADHTTCNGDSGGPMLTSIDGIATIIGATSYGPIGCTGAGDETRADRCAAWIEGFIPDDTPPQIALVAPHQGDTVPTSFDVTFDASDNLGVTALDVLANGQVIGTLQGPLWTFTVPGGTLPAGSARLTGIARDAHGNQASSAEISIDVKKLGDTPGDLGTQCTTDAECTNNGLCKGGTCSRACTASAPCPAGFSCEQMKDFSQWCQPVGDPGGCTAVPSEGARRPVAIPLLLVSALLVSSGTRWFRSGRSASPRAACPTRPGRRSIPR